MLPGPDRRRGDRRGCRSSRQLSFRCQTRSRSRPDGPVQPVDRFIVLLRRPQGIARRENMAGIHAHTQTLGVRHAVEDIAGDARSDGPGGPLAGGRLQVDRHRQARGAAMDLDRGPGDPCQARLPRPRPCGRRDGRPGRRSRATRSARPRPIIASIDFCHRSSSGLARLIRYEVWATGSTIPVSPEAESKGRDMLVGQGRGVPLVVVLREELDGLEADRRAAARTARSQPPAIDMWAPNFAGSRRRSPFARAGCGAIGRSAPSADRVLGESVTCGRRRCRSYNESHARQTTEVGRGFDHGIADLGRHPVCLRTSWPG